jgi:hypothetical protein
LTAVDPVLPPVVVQAWYKATEVPDVPEVLKVGVLGDDGEPAVHLTLTVDDPDRPDWTSEPQDDFIPGSSGSGPLVLLVMEGGRAGRRATAERERASGTSSRLAGTSAFTGPSD